MIPKSPLRRKEEAPAAPGDLLLPEEIRKLDLADARSVVDEILSAAPDRSAAILSLFIYCVKFHIEVHPSLLVLETLLAAAVVDAFAREEAGFIGRLPLAHPLHDHDRTAVEEVGFPEACRAGRAHVVIAVQSRAENRRIADPAGDLECKAGRGGHARKITVLIEGTAVNRAVVTEIVLVH